MKELYVWWRIKWLDFCIYMAMQNRDVKKVPSRLRTGIRYGWFRNPRWSVTTEDGMRFDYYPDGTMVCYEGSPFNVRCKIIQWRVDNGFVEIDIRRFLWAPDKNWRRQTDIFQQEYARYLSTIMLGE